MPGGILVSIVTPVLNMAGYVRETIESVLAQDYPDIEYIVMDGGSTDGTLEILESYKHRLRYYSGPDKGTADAINQGAALASGSVLAWLNADDTYLPGAVSAAVRHLSASPLAAAACGQAYWVDGSGKVLSAYPTARPDFYRLQLDCCVCQPACFFRREDFLRAGQLDKALQIAFDYDLWIRLARNSRIELIPHFLATSRMHPDNKTLGNREALYRESFRVLKRHCGYIPLKWIYSYAAWLRDGRDQFYQPMQPSLRVYCRSLPLGFWQNRAHPLRYAREWASAMTVEGVKRRCKELSFRRLIARTVKR
ncbi:MAG: glycosyltransferase [Acidobacteriales bacterium]|nr:glycosyltransferase [Terriglobales bacterium]